MGHKIKALAYADDVIVLASSKIGMCESLAEVKRVAREQGLLFNTSKCPALLIVPSGRDKKFKLINTQQFKINNIPNTQMARTDQW